MAGGSGTREESNCNTEGLESIWTGCGEPTLNCIDEWMPVFEGLLAILTDVVPPVVDCIGDIIPPPSSTTTMTTTTTGGGGTTKPTTTVPTIITVKSSGGRTLNNTDSPLHVYVSNTNTHTVTVTTNPSGVSHSWASSNTNIVTVANNTFTGKSEGITYATVTAGGASANIKVITITPLSMSGIMLNNQQSWLGPASTTYNLGPSYSKYQQVSILGSHGSFYYTSDWVFVPKNSVAEAVSYSTGDWRDSDSTDQNCLGYVLNKDEDLGWKGYVVSGATHSSDYDEAIPNYMSDVQKRKCYRITSYSTPIPKGWFRMAFRLHPTSGFHVVYQLGDGSWAGKHGTGTPLFPSPAINYSGNPSTNQEMWTAKRLGITIQEYPDSMGTRYFAVSP